jgi:hypothetical protein
MLEDDGSLPWVKLSVRLVGVVDALIVFWSSLSESCDDAREEDLLDGNGGSDE